MANRYRNSPIVEALCEFHFFSNKEWDITIPGLIYGKIKSNFPKKEQVSNPNSRSQPLSLESGYFFENLLPQLRFFTEDGTTIVQIAPNWMTVNKLKPYEGWEKFKKIIMDNFSIYIDTAKPKGIKKINLRYINEIELINERNEILLKLKEYFNYYPSIPENIISNLDSFLMQSKFFYEGEKEELRISMGPIISKKPDILSFALDINYIINNTEIFPFKNIPFYLDKAHEKIKEAFTSCITEKTEDVFEKGEL